MKFRGSFEIRTNVGGNEYFVLRAANGEIIMKSQAYRSRRGLMKGIRSVRITAPIAKVRGGL